MSQIKCIESIYLMYQMRLALGFLLLHGHLGNRKNTQNFNRTSKIIFCSVSVTCCLQECGWYECILCGKKTLNVSLAQGTVFSLNRDGENPAVGFVQRCKPQVRQWCASMTLLWSSCACMWVTTRKWEIFLAALWKICFTFFVSFAGILMLVLWGARWQEGVRGQREEHINDVKVGGGLVFIIKGIISAV